MSRSSCDALDFGAARVAELVLEVSQLVADDVEQHVGIFEDRDQAAIVSSNCRYSSVSFSCSSPVRRCRRISRICLRLRLGQLVAAVRPGRRRSAGPPAATHRAPARASSARTRPGVPACARACARAPRSAFGERLDQLDHLVDVGERDGQAFEDVRARARLAQLEDRAPRDDFAAMADERFEHLLEVQQPRLAIDQRDHVDAEHRLCIGVCWNRLLSTTSADRRRA